MSDAPPPRRRHPRVEVATHTQLGLRPTVMLWRGLFGRCPVCRERRLFHRWFTMVDRCPRCDLRFERIEGHWIGAIGVNTVCVMGLMLIVLGGVTFAWFPDPPPIAPLLVAEIVIAVAGPLVFFPASRTLWSAMDLLMRPLAPGEVDPRFVVVDPLRTAPRPRASPATPAPGDVRRAIRAPRTTPDPLRPCAIGAPSAAAGGAPGPARRLSTASSCGATDGGSPHPRALVRPGGCP